MSTIGTIELLATINTGQYKKGASDIKDANKLIEDSTDNTDKQIGKHSSSMSKSIEGVGKVGFGALVAASAAALGAVVLNIGNAVKRIDTLNNFPKVLTTMGVKGEDAARATEKIAKSLSGLPTSLDEGAAGVQQFVAAGLKVDRATDLFLAMNNALIAGGGNAADAQITFDGMVRAISSGEVPSSTLVAILSRMPTVMQGLEKSTGKTKDELVDLFEKDPQLLIDSLIKLNKEGGGGMSSLDTQARNATGGIATSFDLMNTSITRGIVNIIKSIGNENIANSVTSIGKTFEAVLTSIGNGLAFLIKYKDIFAPLAVSITTIVVAMTAWNLITKAVAISQVALNAAMAANPIGLVVFAIAGLIAGLAFFFTQTETGRQVVQTVFAAISGFISALVPTVIGVTNSVTKFFGDAWNNIRNIFSGVGSFFTSVWNTITSIFGRIGVAIGDAIGNSFRSVVNSVTSFAVGKINGFIDAINAVVGVINKIPGVSVGSIGRLGVPQLATGGIVSSATLAMIGEGREPEAVIPLSKLDAMLQNSSSSTPASNGKGFEVNVYPQTEIDWNAASRRLARDMAKY